MRTALILFHFVFIQYLVFSQNGTIYGVVRTETGTPINADIQFYGKLISTGESGEFHIDQVPFGEHTFRVSADGYETLEKQIVLSSKELEFNPILKTASQRINEVEIIAERSANQTSVEIGKIPIRPFDLPQATATISQEVLDQQQVQQMSDVLKNTNGVYIMGNTGGYQEEIAGRGFSFSSNNTFKNGIRFNNTILPEMSGLERVEILKGSAAILYGNVAAGGVLNLITKKPQFEQGGTAGIRIGSFNFYKPTIDIYGPINKKNTFAYRVNTTYQKAGSFRDNVTSERYYINPSFLFKNEKGTEILVEGDYLNDTRTADFGVGAINYELIDIPRSTFLGFKWNRNYVEQQSTTVSISQKIAKNWSLKSTNGLQHINSELLANVRPNSGGKTIKEDGTWIRGVQQTETDETYLISQLDLIGRFSTGKLEHQFIAGIEYDQYDTKRLSYNSIGAYDTINIFQIDYNDESREIPVLSKNTDTYSPQKRSGIYVQDLIHLSKKWKMLAGIRFSYLERISSVFKYSTQTTTSSTMYDHAFSPRLGLVYQPTSNSSIFASYANSFAPNTGVDTEGRSLAPSITDQYELGVKNDLFKGVLSANITAYYIINSNVAQMSLENGNTDSNIKELAGAISSQGLELDLSTKSWKGFSALAGYSFNETKYTKSNIYAAGSILLYQPRNTANLSVFYKVNTPHFLRGLSAGISTQYFGKRFGGRLPRLTVENDDRKPIALPEYFTLDASIGYSKEKFDFRLKASNIFDALSYNVHDDNSINPIAPRTFTGTICIHF